MNIERIAPQTTRGQVYDQLKRKIISAEILPGQVMTLKWLADGFGVSSTPVREALRQLESERVIVIESNKRIYVNRLTAPEVEDILRVRLVLEPMAAEASCRLRPDAAVAEVRRSLDAMEASIGRPKEYMLANSHFHFGIYSHAGSPALLLLIESLWVRIGPYFVISSNTEQNRHAIRYHRNMWDAFVRRDSRQMRESLCGDLERAAEIMMPMLQSRDSDGVEAGPAQTGNSVKSVRTPRRAGIGTRRVIRAGIRERPASRAVRE
jgi:DNA-binding GntR family transcriptional regulator